MKYLIIAILLLTFNGIFAQTIPNSPPSTFNQRYYKFLDTGVVSMGVLMLKARTDTLVKPTMPAIASITLSGTTQLYSYLNNKWQPVGVSGDGISMVDNMAGLIAAASSFTSQSIYYVKGFYNPNDGGNGYFTLVDTVGASALSGMVVLKGSTQAYVRVTNKSDNVNPLWFGAKASDTTFDNAPSINAAIDYAYPRSAKIVLNSGRAYTIKTTIQGKNGASFELGYGDSLVCAADGISVITVVQGFGCTLNGVINLKTKVSVGVTMDGKSSFGTQNFNNVDYVFNVKGSAPTVLGQTALRMKNMGNDTANSTRTSYIKFIHLKSIAVDTTLTIRLDHKAYMTNTWIDFMCFNNVNGIYISTDGTKGTAFAGNRFTGNITASDYTQYMLRMYGTAIRENIIDMKYEDVERHETSKKDLPIQIGAGTTGNWFRFRGIETDNVYDAGYMNILDMKDVGNDPAITQNSTLGTLPSGGFDRPQGDLSDILLGIDKKTGFATVSTSSGAVSGAIKNLFDLDNDAIEGSGLPTSYNIADAVSSDQTILIGLKMPVRNPKDFIVSFAPGQGVKRCMVEAYSVDSLKWYTIRDYDTLSGINRELIYNLSQVIPTYTIACTNVPNSPDTICHFVYNRIPFKNLDSIRITIRANDVNPVSGVVQIRKVSLTNYGADANAYVKTTGATLYGAWDFTNTVVTGLDDSSGVSKGKLIDFDMPLNSRQGAYNVDGATTGTKPENFTIGEIWFSNSVNSGIWDSIQPASQLLLATNGILQNSVWHRTFSSGTWSAWSAVGELKLSTTNRTAISAPAEGLQVYDITLHKLYVWDGSVWQACF